MCRAALGRRDLEHLDGRADRAQRIAQLVRHHGQELVFRAAVARGPVALVMRLSSSVMSVTIRLRRSPAAALVVVSDRLTSHGRDSGPSSLQRPLPLPASSSDSMPSRSDEVHESVEAAATH